MVVSFFSFLLAMKYVLQKMFYDVPLGYTSGVISSVNVYNSATFASKGYTPGTYTWTWGSGATSGTLIIQIGP